MLNEYEEGLALPALQVTETENEAKKFLSLTPAELNKMTHLECGEAAYVLSRFAFFLQRSVNKERSRLTWAEKSIVRLTCKFTISLSNYYHRDERLAYAVTNDEAAKKYDAIRVHCLTRIDRLDFLSTKVQDIARTLMSLQHSKRGNNGSF